MNTVATILIAVLNTMWQAGVLAALVWLILRFVPGMNAATRFAVWWAALGVVLMLPAAPYWIARVVEWSEPATLQVSRPAHVPSLVTVQFVELPPLVTVEPKENAWWPVGIAVAWGMAALYQLVQILRSYLYLRGLKRRSLVSGEALPSTGRAATLLTSTELDSPIAVGFRKPAVILPEGLAAELSKEEMDHVLLHETAHLARRDDWTNLVGRLLGALMALHPVAQWILRRIEIEREAACDDWVVARTRSARLYAQSLMRVHDLRFARRPEPRLEALASGIFGGGSRLVERIEVLVQRGHGFMPRVSSGRVAAGIAAVVVLGVVASMSPGWIALAQEPKPAFDVVSIKRRMEPMNGADFAAGEGGRLHVANNEIANLITNAYGIARYQLINAPDWVTSESYDMEARGTANADRKQMMLMLQTTLADRFAMRAHFETREIPAFILTVAKGGPKMSFLSPENCVVKDDTKPAAEAPANACGNSHISLTRGWNATHNSMPDVTGGLAVVMRAPVIDQTGIKGTFDFRLLWNDDLAAANAPADAPPSIYVALRETLGLELKSGRGPVRVLVIDHIERPSQN